MCWRSNVSVSQWYVYWGFMQQVKRGLTLARERCPHREVLKEIPSHDKSAPGAGVQDSCEVVSAGATG